MPAKLVKVRLINKGIGKTKHFDEQYYQYIIAH